MRVSDSNLGKAQRSELIVCYTVWRGLESSVTGTTLQVGRTRDRFQAVKLGIYSVETDISVCPGVDSASKNELPGYSWG